MTDRRRYLLAQISRENGGPGVVVGTAVQRAHYFGVSKTLQPITDPVGFKGIEDRHIARAEHQLQRRVWIGVIEEITERLESRLSWSSSISISP